MRLTDFQRNSITEASKIVFGENSRVFLFGSRVDDNRRGGDIDLFIECQEAHNTYENRREFLIKLYRSIGEQKIDVIIKTLNREDDRLIVREALSKGILL